MTTRWPTPACRSGLLVFSLAGVMAWGNVPLGCAAPSLAQVQDASPRPLLRPGDRGDRVSQLQRELKNLGLYSGPIDGLYGADTAAAVRSLQQQQGIAADGTMGAQTWPVLNAALRQSILTLPSPALGAQTLAFTPLVVARPAPPPSALWLALMPLVPIAGGALTYLHRRLKHQQVFRQRLSRRRRPPQPSCSGKGPQ
ncbi:peptidoglycan-binding protein [Nodosilinea sp. LEGE 06152]|uniref:peptidoglycan-binding domain-containing protein n=1 Tax=Nodosilinea sp. LEGE 06152 TaxID=2777966 RepID=UPI0018809DC0|nr:peptidoglycan-binding domain-containing protein [Nodosilinea sp. LEGE 06152]MBE9155926.1 peptidoglycan-binding protein [Nodosilinea sp. LEGE 06152]